MARFYVLIRLKDLSHVEAEFNTQEELNEFFRMYENKMIPHETEIIDYQKQKENRNQETLGWVIMIGIGLLTIYFIFK